MSLCSTTHICCAAFFLTAFSAEAQSPADFYKGKSVNVLIGVGVGGFYDLNARVVARHIGRHIPVKDIRCRILHCSCFLHRLRNDLLIAPIKIVPHRAHRFA